MEIEDLLGICCVCKKIRIDNKKKIWLSRDENSELYDQKLKEYGDNLTHGYCPEDYVKAMNEIKERRHK